MPTYKSSLTAVLDAATTLYCFAVDERSLGFEDSLLTVRLYANSKGLVGLASLVDSYRLSMNDCLWNEAEEIATAIVRSINNAAEDRSLPEL